MYFKRDFKKGALLNLLRKAEKIEARSMGRLYFSLSFYFLIGFWSSIAIIRALWELLWHPLTFFHQKKREGQHCNINCNSMPCFELFSLLFCLYRNVRTCVHTCTFGDQDGTMLNVVNMYTLQCPVGKLINRCAFLAVNAVEV